MWSSSSSSSLGIRLPSALLISLFISSLVAVSAGNFNQLVNITWGDGRGEIKDGGDVLSLTMDKTSGSGFRSKKEYLFGRFDIHLKLVPNNSAGLVTSFYLSSLGAAHDEIDLEFLGNTSGNPYTLETNIYVEGQGRRERNFKLWFDPSEEYHKYSIVWNPKRIVFMVDDEAIRVHENKEHLGAPFPTKQPMKFFASLYNGDQWATQGGRVKIDWSHAPFKAYYKNLTITKYTGDDQTITPEVKTNILKLEKEYMVHNFCDFMKNIYRHECDLSE